MNITRRWTIAIIAVIAIGMALFVGGIASAFIALANLRPLP